jgi:hypothetical protein
MSDLHVGFVSKSFLRSHWDLEHRASQGSEHKKALDDRLALWAKRTNEGDFGRIRVHRRILPRDMGLRPDRAVGFRDWVLSLSEVRLLPVQSS